MTARQRGRRRPVRGSRLVPGGAALTLAALTLAVLGLSACAGSQQRARDEAVTAVRAEALALRGVLASAARGSSGAAQLEAVRAALPDVPLEAAADGQGVSVTGAMTARGEVGGGLSYEGFIARVCLRYSIAADTGGTEIADAPCAAAVEAVAPADATVQLEQ